MGRDRSSSLEQLLDHHDGRRVANVIRVAFQRQAQRCKTLAAQGPQRGQNFVEEDVPLGFIDLANLLEQLKIHALLLSNPVKRGHIFGEARAAVAQARAQELWGAGGGSSPPPAATESS